MKNLLIALLGLCIAGLLVIGCEKEEPTGTTTDTSAVEKKPPWAGTPGGPNSVPTHTYVKVIDTVDFNFAMDTLTCGKLHLTWTTPIAESTLRQFLKHGNLTNTCTGHEVIGDNVLIDYNAGCAFNVGETYPDIYMWGFYRATSNDTTYTYEYYSTQVVSMTMGAVPSYLCN